MLDSLVTAQEMKIFLIRLINAVILSENVPKEISSLEHVTENVIDHEFLKQTEVNYFNKAMNLLHFEKI